MSGQVTWLAGSETVLPECGYLGTLKQGKGQGLGRPGDMASRLTEETMS